MMLSRKEVTEKELEFALHSVAQLLNTYGDKYWPIFERLEKELELRRSKVRRIKLALEQSPTNCR